MQNRGSSKLVRKAEEPQSVDFSPDSIDFYFTLVDSGHARLGQLAWLEECSEEEHGGEGLFPVRKEDAQCRCLQHAATQGYAACGLLRW
jgi:hypothetical protein